MLCVLYTCEIAGIQQLSCRGWLFSYPSMSRCDSLVSDNGITGTNSSGFETSHHQERSSLSLLEPCQQRLDAESWPASNLQWWLFKQRQWVNFLKHSILLWEATRNSPAVKGQNCSFIDKSIKLGRVANLHKTNISWYGAMPNLLPEPWNAHVKNIVYKALTWERGWCKIPLILAFWDYYA